MSTIPKKAGPDRPEKKRHMAPQSLRNPLTKQELAELPSHNHHHHQGDEEPASWQHKAIITLVVVAPMIGFIVAIFLAWQFGMMSPMYLTMLIGGWFITGVGITVGFHRMLTHRSFDTYDWVRIVWAGIGSLAIEGPPLAWCAVHRKHHQHSDHHGDPHSPHLHGDGWMNSIKGAIHAHFGWLFQKSWSEETLRRYVPDLMNVPGMAAIGRQYVLWIVASIALPGVFAGLVTMSWTGFWLGLLWGGLARIFLTHHVTWSINSICHIFGKQDFYSGDDSRNNVIFGILSHGEGWHNNHHAFPTSARHGLKWWQFDTSWLIIRGMQAVGLVWNVRTPSEKAMESKRIS